MGEGNESTMTKIEQYVGREARKESFQTGTKVFDWIIPEKWIVNKAYVISPDGEKILDYHLNNLCLVQYSVPVNIELSLESLDEHLFSLSDQPNAIPYATSYYEKKWGFCISDNQRKSLKRGKYKVVIDSVFEKGKLETFEFFFQGRSEKEILLSTYFCHPSMANDNISGLVVAANLARQLKELEAAEKLRFSVRIIFLPETIGSIAYLSRYLRRLKKVVIAGYVLTCLGDERSWSFLPSRNGNTLADRVARQVLKDKKLDYIHYKWEDRGSDERQYSSPGVDLPVASVMRTKYWMFPEYHTSLDRLGTVVTERGLSQTFDMYMDILTVIQNHCHPKALYLCEPNMGRRNLYPTFSQKNAWGDTRTMMNVLSYCDGKLDCIDIAEALNVDIFEIIKVIDELKLNGLVKI